jgi:hypothetical protein
LEVDIIQPPSNSRALRGVLDAAITAFVPVVTVAVTQRPDDLDLGKLILLGFTSQAIRAAVIPESVAQLREEQVQKPAPVS